MRGAEREQTGFLCQNDPKTLDTDRKSVLSIAEGFPWIFLGKEGKEGQVYESIPQEAALQAGGTELSTGCETAPRRCRGLVW